LALTLPVTQEPKSVITFAGQYWNLRVMNDDQLNWLQSKFDPQEIKYHNYLAAIEAELVRRQPSPEKLKIIEKLRNNSAFLLEKFSEFLSLDDLLLSDLATGKGRTASSRYGEGLDLALSGRWELPDVRGQAYLVDSYLKEFGGLKYHVKCGALHLHPFNQCSCDDFIYKACGKLHGWCKHVCCVWFLIQAQKL
jgi:hypothetical protein